MAFGYKDGDLRGILQILAPVSDANEPVDVDAARKRLGIFPPTVE